MEGKGKEGARGAFRQIKIYDYTSGIQCTYICACTVTQPCIETGLSSLVSQHVEWRTMTTSAAADDRWCHGHSDLPCLKLQWNLMFCRLCKSGESAILTVSGCMHCQWANHVQCSPISFIGMQLSGVWKHVCCSFISAATMPVPQSGSHKLGKVR